MPSCNAYHLTWVSLTLDEGYLLTSPLLILNVELLLSALLRLLSHLSLDVGLLLSDASLDLGCGVARLGRHP